MATQARGLQNFIHDLRNAKSKVRETEQTKGPLPPWLLLPRGTQRSPHRGHFPFLKCDISCDISTANDGPPFSVLSIFVYTFSLNSFRNVPNATVFVNSTTSPQNINDRRADSFGHGRLWSLARVVSYADVPNPCLSPNYVLNLAAT